VESSVEEAFFDEGEMQAAAGRSACVREIPQEVRRTAQQGEERSNE
jgi:hypothetical protein